MKNSTETQKAKDSLVIVLLGPTASGKTKLALEIAKVLDLSIINIDSRQLYKGMNIGTAKPTKDQQTQVEHHLLDLRLPNQPITVQEFRLEAEKKIEQSFQDRGIAFLVGGSGLYLKAITAGLNPPAIGPQKSLRKQLQDLGQNECYQILSSSDPKAAARISSADAMRTERALEVLYGTGKEISSQQSASPPPWQIIELGLDPIDLADRIAKRTSTMYSEGLLEETDELTQRYGPELPMLKTIGYEEALKVLNNELNTQEAIAITTTRTQKFAKRQRTWFKKQHEPHWLKNENALIKALTLIPEI
ncbi:tRNA (adenosine(37)-N6)-dimethylallyltransferase MiaA [Prochlorococcus sp. MIT 1341]|uniref:tRNA (adenosine(37)-N6)-dimethylallyltransferase MiaA n=1 Tax=Prochlorococcus sp. MIT 1341 TaxID=3096221 RepID=UPI002A7484A0|nr:tRNA (adenosine(37)-N6)-dimethylallyltransferase MiaA [Prochlorococcus sp. MIT 1341]